MGCTGRYDPASGGCAIRLGHLAVIVERTKKVVSGKDSSDWMGTSVVQHELQRKLR